jgi:GTP-binding protein
MNYNYAKYLASYGTFKQLPPCDTMEIAFSGRSNVGKSTLINKIFNRKNLARVSSVPGKTVTINFFELENIHFVDLPGYGYAKVSKSEKERWAGLIEGYLNSDRDIRLIIQLIDMRHPPSKDDLHMVNFLVENELPFIVVLTKADKLKKMARIERMEAFKTEIPYYDQIDVIPFSSETGEGVEEVRKIIEEISLDID